MRQILATLFLALISSAMVFQYGEENLKIVKLDDNSQMDSEKSEPEVELDLSGIEDGLSWGAQIRYSINVNDETDGASRYNEINPQEVFLEINFYPENESPNSEYDISQNVEGLTLLGRSSCFGCHADKSTMIGPSFSDMADAYNNDAEGIAKLVNSIRQGSTEVWGEAEMPAYPDITEEDAANIAEYILVQGGQKYSWIYPGLEGVFRVIDKPVQIEKGTYSLTALYTSSANERGEDKIVLDIK